MKNSNINSVNELKRVGYTVLKKKIPQKNCLEFKKIINNFNLQFKKNPNQIEYNFNLPCINKKFLQLAFDKDFNEIAKLFFHYEVDKKIRSKNIEYHLNYIHHRSLNKPSPPQKLHVDGKLPGSNPPLALSIMIYLDDVDEKSGPFTVLPKSHLSTKFPKLKDYKRLKKITGKKGTITIISGGLFHGSSKKTNYNSRSIIIINFTRWFVAQNFALPLLLDKKVLKTMKKEEKKILGFYDYPALVNKKYITKPKKNIFFNKGSILVAGNSKDTIKLIRNLYRKNVLDYKFIE